MRIIPKKTRVKNTIWKSFTLKDMFIALAIFCIAFILLINNHILLGILILVFFLLMFIPTSDGHFYLFLIELIKYFFTKKNYQLSEIDTLLMIDTIEEGVIKYTDGKFAKVLKIGQKNFEMEEELEQDIDISYLAGALKQIDINQKIDIVKIDRVLNLDHYSEDLFLKIKKNDEEENKEVRNIKRIILKERLDRIDQLNNILKQVIPEYYIVVYANLMSDLESTINNIHTEINKCGLDNSFLDTKETAIFLKYTLGNNFDERAVNQLSDSTLLDWIKPQKIQFSSGKISIDGIDSTVFAISDYPLKVKNAWGKDLFNIPNTKVVMHILPVDKKDALKRIDSSILELETKEATSEKTSDSREFLLHKETMINLLNSIQAENETLFDIGVEITVYDYLKDGKNKRKVRQILNAENFKINNLYVRQKEGFCSSLINDKNVTSLTHGINSSSLAAFFPFIRNYAMDEQGILLGDNRNSSYPFILNLWKRGNLYQNSNAMVIGKSGSGKSFFLKNLIVNEWSNGTKIIVCDPEAEYLKLTRNLAGSIIEVGNAAVGKINPFQVYQILSEDGLLASSSVTFNTHLKMLESFMRIVLGDIEPIILEMFNNLIIEAYRYKGIDENSSFINLKNTDYPLFSDLEKVLEEHKLDYIDDKDRKIIRLYLQKFTTGRYSDIWNHYSSLEVEADIIDFNFQSLFANKNNVVANAQMLLVFRFIEQNIINSREKNKLGSNLKTLIIVDEAHLFIDAKYPIALDFFYQMNKRIRKYDGSFIPATQNISDWNGNEELKNKTSTILKNSQYLLVFKLSAVDMKDMVEIYNSADGLNKEEEKMIVFSTTGEAFFIGSSELRSMVKIKTEKKIEELFGEG